MNQLFNGIYLRHINYSETSIIVKVFTKEYGTRSFLIKGGRKKRSVMAAMQPFHTLEISSNFKPEKDLNLAQSVQLIHPLQSVTLDIRKSTVAVFITEVLYEVLREEPMNKSLYEFLSTSINWYDHAPFNANFHLLMLVELTNFLGIRPSERKRSDELFSMEKGEFQHPSMVEYYFMDESNSEALSNFLKTSYSDLSRLRIDNIQRKNFLNAMIKYFEIQLSLRADKISSHKVLEAVFS